MNALKILAVVFMMMNTNSVLALLPPQNNLDAILTRKAVVSNIFNNLRSEISAERLFVEISSIVPYHHHNDYLLTIPLFGTYFFGQFRYMTGEKEQYKKLKKINRYKKFYNVYRTITFVFLLMFFKDVESVF
jgi:hypothetical protein